MAKNPRSGVNPGDPLAIAASQVNFVNHLMNTDTSFRAGPMNGWQFGNNVILCRNDTGLDVPRWGVVAIDGIEISPVTDDRSRRGFESMPCIHGTVPATKTRHKFAVAVEPIRDGAIGRVCVAGVVQAKVEFVSTTHATATPKAGSVTQLQSADGGPAQILWASSTTPGARWALIRFGETPPMRIAKVADDWPVGECATVDVWEDFSSECCPVAPPSAESIENVINLSFNVPAGSWVLVSQTLPGRWVLVEAGIDQECQRTIGGEDVTKWPGWNDTDVQILGHDSSGCLRWFNVTDCASPSPGG